MDTIVDYITNKKVQKLKNAFIKSPTIVNSIQDMWESYEKMQKNIDDYCKKYPDACRDAEELRKDYKLK